MSLLNVAYSASQPWLTDVVSESRPLKCRRIRSEAVVEFKSFSALRHSDLPELSRKSEKRPLSELRYQEMQGFYISLQGVLMSPGL